MRPEGTVSGGCAMLLNRSGLANIALGQFAETTMAASGGLVVLWVARFRARLCVWGAVWCSLVPSLWRFGARLRLRWTFWRSRGRGG